jgi:hypothetical protein
VANPAPANGDHKHFRVIITVLMAFTSAVSLSPAAHCMAVPKPRNKGGTMAAQRLLIVPKNGNHSACVKTMNRMLTRFTREAWPVRGRAP